MPASRALALAQALEMAYSEGEGWSAVYASWSVLHLQAKAYGNHAQARLYEKKLEKLDAQFAEDDRLDDTN